MHYQLQAAYRKESRTADADRELEIYKAAESEVAGAAPRRRSRIHEIRSNGNPLIRALLRTNNSHALRSALLAPALAAAQGGHPVPPPPPPGAKSTKCSGRPIPQLEDITAKTGITFTHTSDPSKKYIVESMSGGVILFDYDRDGWPDIYFTNAPTVEMAIKGEKSRGVLYHNNHDGTFTDVTAKSGLTQAVLCDGRSGRRLRQRRLARSLRHLPRRQTFSTTTTATARSPTSPRKPEWPTAAGPPAQRSATTTATASSI